MEKRELVAKQGRAASAILLTGMVALGVVGPVAYGQTQQQPAFADSAFKRVWERNDLPVAQGKVNRTWTWGPVPGRSLQEPFREGKGGTHLVQYFDKARMEINNPDASPTDPFYVTNGLLVVEMISGRMQIGANLFESLGANDAAIAGDAGSDAPTYAVLQRISSVGLPGLENRDVPLAKGAVISPVYISRTGQTTALGRAVPTIYAAAYAGETGHNIPDVFWNYLNSTGPIFENGVHQDGSLFGNWVSTFGYPITEPYWTEINIAGRPRLVLFQAFQRRILTYSPENAQGWQVEMGNVGAQYYRWRYETPQLACARVPVRGFGRVWSGQRNVQRGVGCPIGLPYAPPNTSAEMALVTAYQPFERGAMLFVSATVQYPNPGPFIYAFFDDGTFQQFDDTWREGQPVSGGLRPPAGLYEPARGFGKVWREGTGARVRERLGWAKALEKGGPGAYQRFERGEMFWSGAIDKIWVLYGTTNFNPFPYPQPVPTTTTGTSPNRYEVFDDTFNP